MIYPYETKRIKYLPLSFEESIMIEALLSLSKISSLAYGFGQGEDERTIRYVYFSDDIYVKFWLQCVQGKMNKVVGELYVHGEVVDTQDSLNKPDIQLWVFCDHYTDKQYTVEVIETKNGRKATCRWRDVLNGSISPRNPMYIVDRNKVYTDSLLAALTLHDMFAWDEDREENDEGYCFFMQLTPRVMREYHVPEKYKNWYMIV
jgi:hypothetical protein